jgi:hypothetical protein
MSSLLRPLPISRSAGGFAVGPEEHRQGKHRRGMCHVVQAKDQHQCSLVEIPDMSLFGANLLEQDPSTNKSVLFSPLTHQLTFPLLIDRGKRR